MYRFEDHTGEVRLHLAAPTLAELFRDAGRAVCALLAGELSPGEALPPVDISLESSDVERLLVDWIDELVFHSESGHLVLDRFDPIEATETRLHARAHGHRLAAVRTAIKAATLHELEVRPTGEGWTASVVLDV
jgi:SHS2 domain-containing protein